MIRASHVIFSTYGFWLPNDPRGSWSEFVGAWDLARLGRATKVRTRESLAAVEHDHWARLEAKKALKYPTVHFSGMQARTVARGFADYVSKARLTVFACSILPEHVHMVIARHRLDVEPIVNQLKGCATRELRKEGLHPLAEFEDGKGAVPNVWARGQWKVFMEKNETIREAIAYVQENPVKEGKRLQNWKFVSAFKG